MERQRFSPKPDNLISEVYVLGSELGSLSNLLKISGSELYFWSKKVEILGTKVGCSSKKVRSASSEGKR